jgi:hypothetical protein
MLQIVTESLVFIIFISVYNKLHYSKKQKQNQNHKCSHEVHNHEFSISTSKIKCHFM